MRRSVEERGQANAIGCFDIRSGRRERLDERGAGVDGLDDRKAILKNGVQFLWMLLRCPPNTLEISRLDLVQYRARHIKRTSGLVDVKRGDADQLGDRIPGKRRYRR